MTRMTVNPKIPIICSHVGLSNYFVILVCLNKETTEFVTKPPITKGRHDETRLQPTLGQFHHTPALQDEQT